MNKERFKGLRWANMPSYEKENKILLVGAGGIGSNTAFLLSRADKSMIIIDYDRVEKHNIGGQFFTKDNIEERKVSAIINNIYKFGGNTYSMPIFTKLDYLNPDIDDSNTMNNLEIFISAVDNMEARNILFDMVMKLDHEALFIDGRLLAEYYKIIVFKNTEKEKAAYYKEHLLKNDSDFEEENCTTKQTTHVAMRLASDIVIAVNSFIENKYFNNKITIPFIKDFTTKLGDDIIKIS